jgi:hypothetical protein
VSEDKALISIEAQLKQELAEIGGAIAPPSSNKIQVKGKVFTLPSGISSPNPLRVTILDFVNFNSYYAAAWNPNVRALPECWAIGKVIRDLTPSQKVPRPQNVDCDSCPKGQFGSAPNGGKGKACKNTVRLLVTPADFASEKADVMTIDISPTGLGRWNKYVEFLAKGHGLLPVQAITEIAFDPNQSFPTLTFDFVEQQANVQLAVRLRNMHTDKLWREPEIRQQAA